MATQDDILTNPPFPLTVIDRELLAMKDEDFHRYTWQDLQRIIAHHTLEDLKRLPSELHRYLRWSHEAKQQYGTITNFVVQERLHWVPDHAVTAEQPVTASSFSHHSITPFEDERDYTILRNDWPYGFAPGTSHIVVWSRTPIAVDDGKGDVTSESRRLIESFVQHTFVQALADDEQIAVSQAMDRVLWFKNWVSLQSVRGIDHIHILVKDVSDRLLQHWTRRVST